MHIILFLYLLIFFIIIFSFFSFIYFYTWLLYSFFFRDYKISHIQQRLIARLLWKFFWASMHARQSRSSHFSDSERESKNERERERKKKIRKAGAAFQQCVAEWKTRLRTKFSFPRDTISSCSFSYSSPPRDFFSPWYSSSPFTSCARVRLRCTLVPFPSFSLAREHRSLVSAK